MIRLQDYRSVYNYLPNIDGGKVYIENARLNKIIGLSHMIRSKKKTKESKL